MIDWEKDGRIKDRYDNYYYYGGLLKIRYIYVFICILIVIYVCYKMNVYFLYFVYINDIKCKCFISKEGGIIFYLE